MKQLFVIPLVLCVFSVAANLAYTTQDQEKKAKQEPATEQKSEQDSKAEVSIDDQFVAVDNMHHFMEYICEPSYKGLKSILANEPADRKAWKAFKNHALVLAETASMVAARGPDDVEKSKQWKQISLDVHKHGKALYKSAGKYEAAKKHYESMIDHCNKCHTVFAEGKHQLGKW